MRTSGLRSSALRASQDQLDVESVLDDQEGRLVAVEMYGSVHSTAAKRALEDDNARSTMAALISEESKPARPREDSGGGGVTMADVVEQCKALAPDSTDELQELLERFNSYELPKRQFNNRLREVMGIERLREALAAVVPDQMLSNNELRAAIKKD